jgi:hypothetical protein
MSHPRVMMVWCSGARPTAAGYGALGGACAPSRVGSCHSAPPSGALAAQEASRCHRSCLDPAQRARFAPPISFLQLYGETEPARRLASTVPLVIEEAQWLTLW